MDRVASSDGVAAPERFVPRARLQLATVATLLLLDAAGLFGAGVFAIYMRYGRIHIGATFDVFGPILTYMDLSATIAVIWVVTFALSGLYDLDRIFSGSGEFTRVALALGFGVVVFIIATFALNLPGLSRAWTLLSFAFAFAFVCMGRLLLRGGLLWARSHGRLLRPTLIVGCNTEAADIMRLLSRGNPNGLRPVGYLASTRAEELGLDYCDAKLERMGSGRDLRRVVVDLGVDTVVIASTAFSHDVIARMIAELRDLPVDIQLSTGLFDVLTSRVLVREVGGVPLITVKNVYFSPVKLFVKRTFDLVVGGIIVLVGVPVWLVLALAIKLTSPGPVLYRQRRTGRRGRPFDMLKFRSMYADADARLRELRDGNEADGPLFKMKDDPRVTPVGRFLRKYSLDEIPQLINVMVGEMSLVGPRPPLPAETEQYSDYHWRRMEVTPGMTGLWQVSGRSDLTFDEMVRLDLFYIENWSVGFDLSLMLRTIPAVLVGEGAY